MVSHLYRDWEPYLRDSLHDEEKTYFESILHRTAPDTDWWDSLQRLSGFLARKSGKKVIVTIDEYEFPVSCAYEKGFFDNVCLLYPS